MRKTCKTWTPVRTKVCIAVNKMMVAGVAKTRREEVLRWADNGKKEWT